MIFNRRREVRRTTVAELTDWQPAEVAAAEDFPGDNRPHLKDRLSGRWVLLDTGATCTVWPKTGFRAAPDPTPTLKAANGTPIRTYGKRTVRLKLGDVNTTAVVTLADVRAPMLGWDWFGARGAGLIKAEDGYGLRLGTKTIKVTTKKPDKRTGSVSACCKKLLRV